MNKYFSKTILSKLIIIFLFSLIIFTLFVGFWWFYENHLNTESRIVKKFFKKIDNTVLKNENSFLLKEFNADFDKEFEWDKVCYVESSTQLASGFKSEIKDFLEIKTFDKNILNSDYYGVYYGMVFSDGKSVKTMAVMPNNLNSKKPLCCDKNARIEVFRSANGLYNLWNFNCDQPK